ncbi:MAG: hypothetical protein WCI77_05985 [Candidatus Omnitrophota bacterium]
MGIMRLVVLVLLAVSFSSCLTLNGKKEKLPKGVEQFKVDLDNDMIAEVVEVTDRFDAQADALVTITKKDKEPSKNKVNTFTVPGRFTKIQFIDLNNNDYKQIVVYYEAKGMLALVIYDIKDNRLSRLFTAESSCGVDGDFDSGLSRVKIGKNKSGTADCSTEQLDTWELWAWSGEKFIKEH